MTSDTNKSIAIAISGSSGAGKTSLTALLKQILPPRVVYIHADAFGKEFEDLPKYQGVLDADSRDSVNFDALKTTIDHVKQHGLLPDLYKSYDFIEADIRKAQDQLRLDFVLSMKRELELANIAWDKYAYIIIVDGFLLYHDSELRDRFNIKLLLRTTKSEAERRRFGRYSEREVPEDSQEFWKTRSYFHQCVWRNYVQEHALLFQNGDVEAVTESMSDMAGYEIRVQPVPDQSPEATQSWAVQSLVAAMREL